MADHIEYVEISRPAAEVWAVLADFGAIARWADNVDHSSLTTEQATGVGAARRVQVGRNALLEEVIVWDEAEVLAYELRGLPPVVRSAVNEWRLEGDGSSTRVTLTTTIDTGPRPPQKVAARVVGRMLGRASRELLDGLRTEMERPADRSEVTA